MIRCQAQSTVLGCHQSMFLTKSSRDLPQELRVRTLWDDHAPIHPLLVFHSPLVWGRWLHTLDSSKRTLAICAERPPELLEIIAIRIFKWCRRNCDGWISFAVQGECRFLSTFGGCSIPGNDSASPRTLSTRSMQNPTTSNLYLSVARQGSKKCRDNWLYSD